MLCWQSMNHLTIRGIAAALVLFLGVLSAEAETFTINGKDIIIPVPEDFARVTEEMPLVRELAQQAAAAGADVVGGEELVAEVTKGNIDFERCFATPDMMPALAKAARILGPKGLMPNPKRGTVVTDVTDVVKRAKGGEVVFKAQLKGIVSNMIGKADMPPHVLCENALAYL